MVLRDALLAEFDHEIAATRRMLACIPESAAEWRPHPKARSFVELAAHLTEVVEWSAPILEHVAFDLDRQDKAASPAATTLRAQRDAFGHAAKRARGLLDRCDAELSVIWTLSRKDEEVFSLPRAAAFRTFVLSHVVHHRGQLSVYLRLNEIVLPAIYGPTADSVGRL